MSAATLSPVAAGPADAAAAAQRVAQLQALLAKAGQGGSPASFAAALEAASGEAGAEGQAASASATPAASGASVSPTSYSAAATTPGVEQSTAAIAPGVGGGQVSGSSATPYDATVSQAAARNNIDPAVLHGLIQQESGFDPNSRSSAGALGLTQLMPGTASSLGVTNPLDPTQSIEGGARYLSEMMSKFGGNVEDALAAYNAGPGAVSQYGGVPPYAETQEYVSKVLGYANAYRQSQAGAAPSGSIA